MDDEAISNLDAMEARAMADRERYEESQFDEDHEPEPSEEDLALKSLDKEHMDDYMAIRRAVARTDLAERLVALAVANGIIQRNA